MLGIHKGPHHAALHGAGPIESNQGDKIREHFRFHIDQQGTHTGTFQLKNSQGITLAEEVIGFRVIKRYFVNLQRMVQVGLSQLDGPVNHRQGL